MTANGTKKLLVRLILVVFGVSLDRASSRVSYQLFEELEFLLEIILARFFRVVLFLQLRQFEDQLDFCDRGDFVDLVELGNQILVDSR